MAVEVEAGLGAEEYPGEEVPEIAGPRNHLVVQGDGSADFNYKVGVLELDLFQGESTEVVAICVVDNKLLVAVPDNIWNRSVQKRKLPQRGLIKPSLVSVTGCVESLRETEEEVAGQLKVWVGLLMPELEGAVEYGTDVEPTFGFGVTSQGLPLVPHADALVEIANELFSFFTAESAPANAGGDDHGARLQQLEAMMEEIRGALATVAGDRKKEDVRRVANPKPAPGPGKPRRQTGKDGAGPAVRGLDAGTVRSAMQAGVPLEHLREVGSILKEKPRKLEELPRQNARRRKGPLSESEEDEEAVVHGGRGRWCRWQRRWYCKGGTAGASYFATDSDRQKTFGEEESEGSIGESLRRRQWFSRQYRQQWNWWQPKEFSCLESSDQMLAGEPSLHLRDCRSSVAVRLPVSSHSAGRTYDPFNNSQGMACSSESNLELSESCSVGMASRWNLGCIDSKSPSRSEGTMRSPSKCGRPSQHRPGFLGDFQCFAVGSSTSVSAVFSSSTAEPSGAAVQHSLRQSLGRHIPGSSQRSRFICRCEEEVEREVKSSPQGRQRRGCTGKGKGPCREGCKVKGQSEQHWSRGSGSMKFEGEKESARVGPAPSYRHSQPDSIHLPGAAAPVFHGRRMMHSFLRHILKGRCRLSSFARSFVSRRFDRNNVSGTATRNVFPMPLPYPEVLRTGEIDQSSNGARKRWLCALTICLNYLFLGRPRSADNDIWVGKPLTGKQWDAVRRMEHLGAAWLDVSPIGPEEMCRTASKVESLSQMLDELEVQAVSLCPHSQGYFSSSKQTDLPGKVSERPGLVLGVSESSSMTTFKPVNPSRLTFMGQPSFDPSSFLDPLSRKIFQDPLQTREDPRTSLKLPPKLRVHCSRSEKIRLFELLDSSNRLALFEASEVTPKFGSGLFSVVKDLERDRMILDSRGANILEEPPGRWIKSLASGEQLCKLTLEPWERLAVSGNDLRDFYYVFQVSASRARRNVLVGSVHPCEVQHLRAYKPWHAHTKALFGCLATLAMGDCQAVELAQSCHLSIGLQFGAITPETLMTMYKPIPRSEVFSGLVIDDFISFAKVGDRFEKGSSLGAEVAGQMQTAYKKVGLIPHEKKAFRDDLASSFCGVDLDGEVGLLRASLKRAIPIVGILLKLVSVGASTGDLLQVVAASLISLFLFRRRMLALLDPIFCAYRIAGPRDIIHLSGEVRSTLLICSVLMPIAVTNLRASSPKVIVASDASNWGEAAVIATIEQNFGKEMLRHSLRKSIWTKLLAPASAWMRSHDLLTEDDELPEGEHKYFSNPLYELCAEAPNYEVLFAKPKSGNRHINVGELRAALKAERLVGERTPSSRVLLGADSQVALGTLIKGRSTSSSLNAELCKSLPWMLAFDSYLECLYFQTKANRGDDPTRGNSIRPPSREWPAWISDIREGSFEAFDKWLEAHGIDDETLSGLPPFSELCQEVGSSKISTSTTDSPASDGPGSEATTAEGSGVGTCQLDRCCPAFEPEVVEAPDPEPARISFKTSKQGNEPLDSSAKVFQEELSDDAVTALSKFPRSMFVLPKGQQWPPREKGFLDLFSGERGVANFLASQGCWSLCVDITHGAGEDLSLPGLRSDLRSLVELDCFVGMGGGPVCTSFSTAITPPVRSKDEPYGKATASQNMKLKMAEGNEMTLWFFSLIECGLAHGLAVWIENPAMSWMFRLPDWYSMQSRWPSLGFWTVDYCRYKTAWRKRTKVACNLSLAGSKKLCQCGGPHQLLRGRSKEHKMSWTRVAQAYPYGFCADLGRSLLQFRSGKSYSKQAESVVQLRHATAGDVARCCGQRIGEAKNPGPRQRRHRPLVANLAEVPLVEPQTAALQTKVWEIFRRWLDSRLSPGAVRSVLSQHGLLAEVLKEYGCFLYSGGQSLYTFRHLVVFTQQSFLGIKPYMHVCWDLITRWEIVGPPSHRLPIPESVLKAMISVSIIWDWKCFAAILGIAFYGIARRGEPLRSFRQNLILPTDLLQDDLSTVFLRIENPKSRRRGLGRIQHISVDYKPLVVFLGRLYGSWSPERRLLDMSQSAFRRCWDAVLTALQIPLTAGLTPGGLRGGGCVSFFQGTSNVQLLLWKMRLRHQQTLEAYLQEAVACSIIPTFSETAKRRVQTMAGLCESFLDRG